ncbi:MAG: hypothetical protein WBP93_17000 [Pyrinomonadaceae bacterium]
MRSNFEQGILMRAVFASLLFALLFIASTSCRSITGEKQSVRARSLRDVPAQRLSYRFEADTGAPPNIQEPEQTKAAPVQKDFETRRKDDALVRTVASPDGQRVLALYDTGDDPQGIFRIDLYSSEGTFLRNLSPPALSCAFPETVAWSPDGTLIVFIASKNASAQPTPTPLVNVPEDIPAAPSPNATPAPLFAPVTAFETEQIYICNRDGYDLKPLTTREGLIYFYLSWSPDSHALVALACKEDEWNARQAVLAKEKEAMVPQGRPRLIGLDGRERLLDDALTEVRPVWSPDSSKVAAGFDTDVGIYDAATDTPTAARIPLREPLLNASRAYDEAKLKSKSANPVSFNPVVRLEWPEDKTLFLQTAYVRNFIGDPVNNFQRWHTLHLSPQAAMLSANYLSCGTLACDPASLPL